MDYSIACRTGLHCAPLARAALGTAPAGAVRLSLGATSTAEDVAAAIHAVRALAAEVAGG